MCKVNINVGDFAVIPQPLWKYVMCVFVRYMIYIYILPILHLNTLQVTRCNMRVWITKRWCYGVTLDKQAVWEHPNIVLGRDGIKTDEGTNYFFSLAQFTQDRRSINILLLSTVRIH